MLLENSMQQLVNPLVGFSTTQPYILPVAYFAGVLQYPRLYGRTDSRLVGLCCSCNKRDFKGTRTVSLHSTKALPFRATRIEVPIINKGHLGGEQRSNKRRRNNVLQETNICLIPIPVTTTVEPRWNATLFFFHHRYSTGLAVNRSAILERDFIY